ncbi:MAG TPA: hypothetical protein VG796_25285 [Verrucomicrobiales bacterium]|jgi:hypothetical protein|nr:hypothetical protein [Verrucomicrobiales bacterium]
MTASFSSRGLNRLRPEGEDREASSNVVHACQVIAHCHLALGIFLIVLAATATWWIFEISHRLRIIDEFRLIDSPEGTAPSPNPDIILNFGVAVGVLCILNAGILFRCRNGLRAFTRTRRVSDLHPAMRRLRTMWLFFSISMLLITTALIYLLQKEILPPV